MVADFLESTRLKIGIIGLGYVGEPLLRMFLNQGIDVIGYDSNSARVSTLKSIGLNNVFYDSDVLGAVNCFIVTVPTHSRDPTRSIPIKSATEVIAKYLVCHDLVIYESLSIQA